MADGPDEGVLAAIPIGQLSERQMRIAAGISLVRDDGVGYKRAAETVGLNPSTLWRHLKGISSADDDRGVSVNAKALVAASFDVAQLAAERLTERLLDEPDSWGNGDLVKAYGVATDKIAMKLRWRDGIESRAADDGASTLAKMLSGATITFPVAPDPAIDVTPDPDDSGRSDPE